MAIDNRSDKDILEEVENALLKHEEISTDQIVVTCENGAVTLTGTVDTLEDSQEVEDMVSDIPGVVLVKNYLKVVKI